MSERFGNCNFCKGTGERWHPIPGTSQVVKDSEATDEERKELTALRTGAQAAKIIEVSQRFFVRSCGMCEGTPGFSGDAMDGWRE